MKYLALVVAAMLPFSIAASPESKPFAEKRVVLQITDNDPEKQTLVLNVATNLMNHYGPEKVDVEIVAFGPGMNLLLKKNENLPRIDGLAQNGVQFSACSNTIAKMTKKLGKEPAINPSATRVPAGVVRIIELVDQDYQLIRP
jgi:intracellular sulfur oxidation DsrE/DsrF family protein